MSKQRYARKNKLGQLVFTVHSLERMRLWGLEPMQVVELYKTSDVYSDPIFNRYKRDKYGDLRQSNMLYRRSGPYLLTLRRYDHSEGQEVALDLLVTLTDTRINVRSSRADFSN